MEPWPSAAARDSGSVPSRIVQGGAMNNCILCKEALTGDEPPEHPLLDALGGRLKVDGVLCRRCNNERLGGGPDRELAESARHIRMLMGFRSGKRKQPPPVRGVVVRGQPIKLDAGGIPSLDGHPPFTVTEGEQGQIGIEVLLRNQDDLERVLPHLAGRLGVSEGAARQMLVDGKWVHRTTPIGVVDTQMSFGGPVAIRSMAKACLVLWSRHCGTEEVLRSAYDDIRHYILAGGDDATRRLSRLDLRAWPVDFKVADDFGPFANVVYVTSNSIGRVLGYFRLYGAIGWCIELAAGDGRARDAIGLASNPEAPGTWSEALAATHPLSYAWLDASTYGVGFDATTSKLAQMLQQYQRRSTETELGRICESVCRRHGFASDDLIPHDKFAIIIDEISAYAAALFCRIPMHRPMQPNEIAKLTGTGDPTLAAGAD